MIIKRVYYLDILRIMAIIAVIMIHVSSQSLYYTADVRSFTWQSLNFWDAMMRWCVPIFVMISGALFLNPKRKLNLKKLFQKNIAKIAYLTIFWHIAYGIFNYFEVGSLREAIVTMIEGYSHLWFLHMLLGLYVLIPLLRKITEDIKLTRYFWALALIFTFLLPTLSECYENLAIYQTMPHAIKVIFDSIAISFSRIYFNFTLGFSAYFVAGHYFDEVSIPKKWRHILYILGLISAIITFAATGILSHHYQVIMIPLYSYTSFNVMLTTFALFIFIKQLSNKIDWQSNYNQKWSPYMVQLSQIVMGIYLVHFFIVTILIKKCQAFEWFNNTLIAVPVISIIVFLLSICLTLIARRIPLLKKFMM
ncbi:acyltransferase [Holzapfeliella floricola]|nr:acyltransferase family protein [Holzapfeliella floricola]